MIKKGVAVLILSLIGYAYTMGQIIHIQTNDVSLVYTNQNAKLHQLYFGKSFDSEQGIENLDVYHKEAYPSFGNGEPNEVALIVTHADGTMVTDLIYDSYSQSTQGNIQSTIVKLQDKKLPFFVELIFKAYKNENVIEQWVVIKHNEKKAVKLEQYASSAIGFIAQNYHLTHFKSSWGKEMGIVEEELQFGIKTIETKRGVRSTEMENPSFVLSLNQKAQENNGEVFIGGLAWTGNYKLSFQLDEREHCQVTCGINPFASDYFLNPGEEFVTPRMIYTYSNSGKNQASINMHRWARKYNLNDGDEIRPIVLNSWEGAYMNFDANLLKSMMNGAAEMGVEIFVLDDGWFGNKYPRNDDKAGLGDWQVNKKKLPDGLSDLIDHAESKGLKFGIWVEPEMVNPKSELAEKHPEWIIQRKNDREPMLWRNQLILDLSNPKVQEFVFNAVNTILTENPRIAYVKWDANRRIQNFGSTYLEDNKQSHLFVDYTKGLEKVLARLTDKHPDVIFQICSSGGGRVDFDMLRYTHEFWASDDTDPLERLYIQWGTNHIYPAIATGAHITKSPSHQSGRDMPLKFRCDMAMGGRLGLELSPDDLTDKQKYFVKGVLETYKKIRHIIQFGDLYRLNSPYDSDGYAAINFVTPEKDTAIAMIYSHLFNSRVSNGFIRFQGLDKDAVYKISELNKSGGNKVTCEGKDISGSILMNYGIKINMSAPYQSVVLKLEKIE